MPYKKTYTRKRSYRPGYKACGKMVYSDAGKALRIAAGLKRLVNVEVKNFDVQQTNVGVTSTPAIIQLSNIPQGDTTITRDGAQCKVLALELSLFFTRHVSAFNTSIRILVVCDKQTNQAIYLTTDLMADVTAIDNIVSAYNLDNKFRFTILLDKVFNLSEGSNSSRHYKKVIRMSKILRFDGSTPSIADLPSNSFSLYQVSNEAVNECAVTMFSRLRYVDN